ncbi:MAG: class I SAM-dependent rRNA methyltransferase, partial [Prolixibacteraceae bacterium]|nr:class I SAM-dependent rRNA methyltransferase [Prolixibacteraceae bacterium]
MENIASVILKSGKDQSVKRFHPWVFSGAIKKITGSVNEGDIVSVYSNKDEFLGLGHYQVGSIAVRIFSFEEKIPDQAFWKEKIKRAIEIRKNIGLINNIETNTFRLVNAEGDGMPGMIIDFYNGVAVTQMHSIGMYKIKDQIVEALKESLGDLLVAIYDKSSKTIPYKSDIIAEDKFLWGKSAPVEVLEYGLKFNVDWEQGQKTGFFIDQRENRRLVQEYSKGRDVLNMFCYTGGFSFFALKGGARMVHSVDSSAKAIDLTNENIRLNF